MDHLSVRARANNGKNAKSRPKIFIWLDKQNDEWQAMTSDDKLNSQALHCVEAISFIEKLPFRPYLLCSKPVKPVHYSVLPSRILRVIVELKKRCYFASILFGKSVKKMYHLSFGARANDVNSTESQPNVLYLIGWTKWRVTSDDKLNSQALHRVENNFFHWKTLVQSGSVFALF